MNHPSRNSLCGWCGEQGSTVVLEAMDFDESVREFSLVECGGCGLVRTEPFLQGEQLSPYYSQDYYGSEEAKFNPALEQLVLWLVGFRVASVRRSLSGLAQPKILDIGCGRGGFLKGFAARGGDCYGLERADFRGGGEKAYRMFYGELAEQDFPSASFDAVCFWHVLEHLENPKDVLDEAYRILKPGGLLLVSVPNFDSWQAKWFGPSWFHLDLPRHLYHFTAPWLIDYLASASCQVKMSSLATIEQELFGFVQSVQNMVFGRKAPNRLYRLMKRFRGPGDVGQFLALGLVAVVTMPFALLETVFSSLFGKSASIILTAKKPLQQVDETC